MIKLYGIPNCDTVKKARNWLAENDITFEFVNFKNDAPSVALINGWLEQIPLETLLNKRGTTWRKLDAESQAKAAEKSGAVVLMAENPSLIKRPILAENGRFHAGFSEENYRKIFGK